MTARFRLVLVRPPGYVHASALSEALEYLAIVLRAVGVEADVAENEIDRAAHNVIACAHLVPANVIAELPRDTIVFNAEPLAHDDDWQFASGAYRDALARFYVWDYSVANLARLPHANAEALPFWYRPEMDRKIACDASDALLFYGVVTPRRAAVLAALVDVGVTVETLFGVYGMDRDRAVRRARAVLDLRKRDAPSTFASLRCFHVLANGVPVIAEEPGDDPSATPFRDAMTVLPVEDFARCVADVLADRDAFDARTRHQLAAFRALDPVPAIAAAVERYLSYTSTKTNR
jgi:hypothetical protein